MTNEEFDSCLLKKKIEFRYSEAARLILVHETSVESATSIVGLAKTDIPKVREVLKMFEDANIKIYQLETKLKNERHT